jgi:signal transduction histidine kinase
MLQKLAGWTERFQRSAFAFPLAVLVAAFMVMISEAAYHQSESGLSTLVRMGQARLKLLNVVQRLSDAESSQRGYLLTEDDDYLKPYHAASQDIAQSLEELRVLYRTLEESPAEHERQVLAALVSTRLSEIEEVLRLHQQGHHDQGVALMLSGIGREKMESIRRQKQLMLTRQNELITQGLSELNDTFLLHRIGVASMTAISLLVLAMFLRQGRALAQHRKLQQEATLAERDRLKTEVAQRTRELTELARHLQNAREDERARLARELHDELGALLTTAKLDVARMKPKVMQQLPELAERLIHLTETLNTGVALKRRIIEDLRPSTLDNLGLCPALEILCRESSERMGVTVHIQVEPVPLSRSAELTIYRLVQEALTNVAKYAQASHVSVQLQHAGGWVLVRIHDNGVGFDPALVPRATHGLLGMRYRVESEHGELRLTSAPGQGTTLTAQVPVADSAAADTSLDHSGRSASSRLQ